MPAFRKNMTTVDMVKTPSHVSIMRKQYEEDYVSMDGTNAKVCILLLQSMTSCANKSSHLYIRVSVLIE